MTRLVTGSDFHLGAPNAYRFRGFSSREEHDEVIFDNFASALQKKDSVILTGDICQSLYWLGRMKELVDNHHCAKISVVPGNHCCEKKIKMHHLVEHYCEVIPYLSKRNCWWSHMPIHPDHLRGRDYNIHGHLHSDTDPVITDPRFINVAIDHWDLKPITFAELIATHESKGRR